MPSISPRQLAIQRQVIFIFLVLWLIGLVIAVNEEMAERQAKSDPGLPFGITSAHGEIFAQDFSYNILFLKGVHDRLVAHPYRLADQEQMMRHILPGMSSGMGHAYSPVAYVLVWPLLGLSGSQIYLAYTSLSALGIGLLFYFCLLPRATVPLQLLALTVCTVSVWLIGSFSVGQSTLLTTSLLGGFWSLLRRRDAAPSSSLYFDGLLALLFWAICFKPSVAIIPAMLLWGSRAWRAFGLGLGLLLATWLVCAGHYGGWWTGLQDYLHLLNHYNTGHFSPFMHPVEKTDQPPYLATFYFSLDRNLILAVSLALIILRWTGRLTGSGQFQGMIWVFLLLSPYLLPTENWILCLLIVEGPFFQSTHPLLVYGKLLLLTGIFDLRLGLTSPIQVEHPLKCLLFLWIMAEAVSRGLKSGKESSCRHGAAFY